MKVILAFDSFKGSLTAEEAVAAAREGVLKAFPSADVVSLPLADGGEGTAEALCRFTEAGWQTCRTHDPLFRPIVAKYGISRDGETAIMDMASSAGLMLLEDSERNPMQTTTFGVGEMILDAIGHGCKHIIIGIGGSATNDGGMGMLAALGVRFHDRNGNILKPVGESLSRIADTDFRGVHSLSEVRIDVVCDVENPLFGGNGAACVYASQKGASNDEVLELDKGLRHFSSLFRVNPEIPGSGAAGGLGYGLLLLGARLRKGVDVVLDSADIDRHLRAADIVITGEGSIDSQTLNGKLPFGVLQRAKAQGVPVVALAGQVKDESLLLQAGFSSVRSINMPGMCQEEAMKTAVARNNLKIAAQNVLCL